MYMGIDQYGETYHNLRYPRKQLMEMHGIRHVSKMYVDRRGKTFHVGYVVGRCWITLYHVKPFEKEA